MVIEQYIVNNIISAPLQCVLNVSVLSHCSQHFLSAVPLVYAKLFSGISLLALTHNYSTPSQLLLPAPSCNHTATEIKLLILKARLTIVIYSGG